VLGTDELFDYLDNYGIDLDAHFETILTTHSKKAWGRFVNTDNQHLVTDEAVDFLSKLLRYDHQERLTAQEAMAHPFFTPVREASALAAASQVPVQSSQSRANSNASKHRKVTELDST
jgi:casein kinase II subunit alpha